MIRAKDFSVRPDLVDESLRIVLEADSFTWHGNRQALRWDARRYNNLVAPRLAGAPLRLEDVVRDSDYVRRILPRRHRARPVKRLSRRRVRRLDQDAAGVLGGARS